MPTTLLDPDGTASMATLLMSSHHAFRRDLACFARALATLAPDDGARAEALREEWVWFRNALHGHHTIEDTSMFPDLRAKDPALAATLAELDAQHRAIDPLLERGDRAFADLAHERAAAASVVDATAALLATHLELEEPAITPHLRAAKDFPAPPGDEMLAMYADGFAWSSAGIAAPVVQQIFAMLPAALVERIPAARARFEDRCRRVWGGIHAGSSTTSAP